MSSKAFCRQHLPYLEQRYASLIQDTEYGAFVGEACVIYTAIYLDALDYVGLETDLMNVVNRLSAHIIHDLPGFLLKAGELDQKLLHATSISDITLIISESRLGLPYWKVLCERLVARMTSLRPVQWSQTLTLYRTLLCYLKRIRFNTSQSSLVRWVQNNERAKENLAYVPDSIEDLCGPDAKRNLWKGGDRLGKPYLRLPQIPTGACADVRHARGKPGLKTMASCTMSRTSWKDVTKYGACWPTSAFYADMRHIGKPIGQLWPVPKDWKTDRAITLEPAAQTWIQSYVRPEMDVKIEAWTHGFCIPCDDTRNKWLIEKRTGFASVDLSNASDLIPYKWINTFPDQRARRLMYASRVELISISKRAIEAEKERCSDPLLHELTPTTVPLYMAGGMGNAWVFALECWVFSAVCLAAGCSEWGVFGDDIVVPEEKYDEVIQLLTSLGFEPNLSKSYSAPYLFRESCGVEGFRLSQDWVPCKPMMHPGRTISESIKERPRKVAIELVDLQRALLANGFSSAPYVISRWLTEAGARFTCDWWDEHALSMPFSPSGECSSLPLVDKRGREYTICTAFPPERVKKYNLHSSHIGVNEVNEGLESHMSPRHEKISRTGAEGSPHLPWALLNYRRSPEWNYAAPYFAWLENPAKIPIKRWRRGSNGGT